MTEDSRQKPARSSSIMAEMGYSINPSGQNHYYNKNNQKHFKSPKSHLTGKTMFSVLVGNYSRQQRSIAVLCLTVVVYVSVIMYYAYLLNHAREFFGLGYVSGTAQKSGSMNKNRGKGQDKPDRGDVSILSKSQFVSEVIDSTPSFITTANNIWVYGFHSLLCMQLNIVVIMFSLVMIYYIWTVNGLVEDEVNIKKPNRKNKPGTKKSKNCKKSEVICPVELTVELLSDEDRQKWQKLSQKLVDYRRRWMTAIFGKMGIDFFFVSLSVIQFGLSTLRVLIAIAVVIFVSAYDFWVIFEVSSFIGRVVSIAREKS